MRALNGGGGGGGARKERKKITYVHSSVHGHTIQLCATVRPGLETRALLLLNE